MLDRYTLTVSFFYFFACKSRRNLNRYVKILLSWTPQVLTKSAIQTLNGTMSFTSPKRFTDLVVPPPVELPPINFHLEIRVTNAYKFETILGKNHLKTDWNIQLLQKTFLCCRRKITIISRTDNAYKRKSMSDILFTLYFQKFVSSLLDFCVYGVLHWSGHFFLQNRERQIRIKGSHSQNV